MEVLLPTCNRLPSLILTLSGLAAQTASELRLVVADQSDEPAGHHPVVQALFRLLRARGGEVEYHARPQVHGIAEQRQFLLERAQADSVLYLEDDV